MGLLPGGCGTQNLPWLVGEGWAKRMILTNERVDAATALRIGLVEEVVGEGQGARRGRTPWPSASPHSEPARGRVLQGPHPQRAQRHRRAARGLALERERFMDLFDHADQAEGVNAFLEKRKPGWKND